MNKPQYTPIRPERKLCDCGGQVSNHHWLCDACYGKKAKAKHRKMMRKIHLSGETGFGMHLFFRNKEDFLKIINAYLSCDLNRSSISLSKKALKVLHSEELERMVLLVDETPKS